MADVMKNTAMHVRILKEKTKLLLTSNSRLNSYILRVVLPDIGCLPGTVNKQ